MVIYKLKTREIALVTNPKSGVTSIAHLLNLLGEDFVRQDVYDDLKIDKVLSEFKNCAIVFRDPYSRAVSMYIRFCLTCVSTLTKQKLSSQNILKLLGKTNEGISFIEFLEYLIETPVIELDSHYRPQQLISRPHFIIRTEYYKKDMLKFFTSAGYKAGETMMSTINDDELVKNSTSISRRKSKEDSSLLSSNKIIAMGKGNLPETTSFLNIKSKKLIETIFSEELRFQKERVVRLR